MFPKIALKEDEKKELLSYKYIGDLVEKAGELSIELFKKAVNSSDQLVEGVGNDQVLEAISHQNLKNIPFERQQKVLSLASDRQQFKRALLLSIINDKKNSLSLTGEEIVLINGIMNASPLVDELFIKWRDLVVYSPLGSKFASDPSLSTKFRKDHNLLTIPYIFSVIQKGEEYKEVPLIVAFPALVKRIIEELRLLSNKLVLIDANIEITNYIDALADLYENDDPEKYEFFSKNLDSLWVHITGRIIPIHPMEVYEDPGKYIVSQELGLAFIDDRYKEVNDGILKTKANLLEYLSKNYENLQSYCDSVPLMERAEASVYSMVVEAGARLIFRPFGQNIPNWDEVRFNEGIRIFIDMNSAKIRWQDQRAILMKLIGEEQVKAVFDPYIVDGKYNSYSAIVNVGGHEIAHNAFITNDVQERISPPLYAKLEETKATFAILSAIDDKYSDEEKKIIVLSEFGSDIMNLGQEDNQAKVAYLNTSLASIEISFLVGLIEREGEGYVIDPTSEKIEKYLEQIKKKFNALVDIYDHGDSIEAKNYMDIYFSRTNEIEALIEAIKL